MSSFVADRRLYLTEDKNRVVEEGDPDAAFLLATPGTEVPEAEAKRLGLGQNAAPPTEPEPEPAEPDKSAGPEPGPEPVQHGDAGPGAETAGEDQAEPNPVKAKVVKGPRE